MANLTRWIVINAPVQDVYAVARDPQRWTQWFDGMESVDYISGSGEAGTRAELQYNMAGMSFPVTNIVLEESSDATSARWHGKIEGPLAGEHVWNYTTVDDGTEVHVEMSYTVPGSVLGKIADRLIVESMQERSLETTLNNLKTLIEGG